MLRLAVCVRTLLPTDERVDAEKVGDVRVVWQRRRKSDDANHSLRAFDHSKGSSHLVPMVQDY